MSGLEPVMTVILRRLAEEGPLSSLDLEDDRRTEGWWDPEGRAGTRAVRQALEWLWHFGRVAISHRRGGRRYFDLVERMWGEVAAPEPFEAGPPPGDREAEWQAYVKRVVPKYVRAMGLANPRAPHFGWVETSAAERLTLAERLVEEGEAVWVEVEGGEGRGASLYLAPAAEVDDLVRAEEWDPEPVLAFLPPLDNLVWDRERLADLFGFDYGWEAYVPPARRRYGPYTCPVLRGDRFVARVDARLDRGRGGAVLVVNGVWWEPGTRALERELAEGLDRWAAQLGCLSVETVG